MNFIKELKNKNSIEIDGGIILKSFDWTVTITSYGYKTARHLYIVTSEFICKSPIINLLNFRNILFTLILYHMMS